MSLLPAKSTLARRTYLTVLGSTALTVFALTLLFIITLEKLELTLSEQKLSNEISFFEKQLQSPHHEQGVKTQFLELYYQPKNTPKNSLPALLKLIPAIVDPEEDEVFFDGIEYQYQTKPLEHGTIYAIQDITLIETTENDSLKKLAITSFIILVLSISFGVWASRRITQPLQKLSSAIGNATPGQSPSPIAVNYREQELQNIATAFNTFLSDNQAYIKRERNLVNIASHELRTPIAISQGALEVIEMRGNLNEKDRFTLKRAKQAMSEMQQNTETLLKLSRGESLKQDFKITSLNQSIAHVINNLQQQSVDITRIHYEPNQDTNLLSDPSLFKMLLNNLLLNALQHSAGTVTIVTEKQHFDILSETAFEASPTHSHGLGLYIVEMICKHHNWQLTQPPNQLGVRIVV